MVEALRRSTLKWEKITLNGKKYADPYYYDDGTRISYDNTLAIRGEFNPRGYVRCNVCGRVFTPKGFEKHCKVTASEKTCALCSCHGIKNPKITQCKNNNWLIKGDVTCDYGYDSKLITKDFACRKLSCDGEPRRIEANFKWAKPIIQSQILTIAAVKNWRCIACENDCFWFDYNHGDYSLPQIEAKFDKNGFLIKICIGGYEGYFDTKSDNYISFTNGRAINLHSNVKAVLREVYA